MTGDYVFAERWPAGFRREIAKKRAEAQRSLDALNALKSPDSDFRRGHEVMLRIYDATLAAIDAEVRGGSPGTRA